MDDLESAVVAPPEERLLAYMRRRAEGHPTKDGTWTVRKGYVGAGVRDLAADQGMTLGEVEDALLVLRDAHLIEFDRARDSTPVRIRVTGGRDEAFVSSWLDARAQGRQEAEAEQDWIEVPGVVGETIEEPELVPSLPILEGLPVIIALTKRAQATRLAAILLEEAGMEQLASEVRLGAQEVTRLEREVLTLVSRLDG